MFSFLKRLLFSFVMLTTVASHAEFIYASIYKLNGKLIVCFGDRHTNGPANLKQREAFIQQLTHMKKKGTVLVEDAYSYSGDNILLRHLSTQSPQQVLAGLVNTLKHTKHIHGFNVVNAEIRYNLILSLCNMKSIKEVFDETFDYINTVHAYNDGPFLTDYYKKTLSRVDQNYTPIDILVKKHRLANLSLLKIWSMSTRFWNFRLASGIKQLKNTTATNEDLGMPCLALFNSELLDVNIIHNTHKALEQDTDIVVICAGKMHIEDIEYTLEQWNGRKIYFQGDYHSTTANILDAQPIDVDSFFANFYRLNPQHAPTSTIKNQSFLSQLARRIPIFSNMQQCNPLPGQPHATHYTQPMHTYPLRTVVARKAVTTTTSAIPGLFRKLITRR